MDLVGFILTTYQRRRIAPWNSDSVCMESCKNCFSLAGFGMKSRRRSAYVQVELVGSWDRETTRLLHSDTQPGTDCGCF